MLRVISDSSTLIHLTSIGKLELLRDYYDNITVPPAVWREVVIEGEDRSGAVEIQMTLRKERSGLRPRAGIGGHLVKKLKREGYWVRGVDIKEHEYAPPPVPPNIGGAEGQADEFLVLDLRDEANCQAALSLPQGRFDEVY